MSALPLGLMAGGSLLSGIGSLVGGNSQARAVRRADDDQVARLRQQQGLVGNGLLGNAYGNMPYYQTIYSQGLERNDPNLTQQGLSGIQNFTGSLGGSVLDQQRQLADTVSQRQTGNLSRFDQDTSRLSGMAGGNDAAVNGMWSQGASNLNGLAAGGEQLAASQGVGRDRTIRRDADRQQTAANQQSRAALSAAGLGNSSALGNQMQANAQATGESRDRALQANSDSRLSAMQTARGQRLSTGQNLLAGQAGAMERSGQSQIGREYQRAGDRQTLENQNLTRDIGLRQDPINTIAGTLSGSMLNPYSNYNAPVVPAGGSANALGSLGGSLTAGSNYLTQQNALQQLLQQMQGGGGGGQAAWSGVYGPG